MDGSWKSKWLRRPNLHRCLNAVTTAHLLIMSKLLAGEWRIPLAKIKVRHVI